MGFLNDQNKTQVENHVFNVLKDLKSVRNGLGLNKDGLNWIGAASFAHFDQSGAIDFRRVIELVDEALGYAAFREDYPHPHDEQLDWLRSIEDINECSVEKMRRFSQPVAKGEMTRDSSGRTLAERFNDRILWLGQNKVHRPNVDSQFASQPTKPLSEEEKRAASVKAGVDAIRAEIDAIPGTGHYAANQRARLHKRLNELLADRSFKYRDRYAQQTLTGIDAIMRQIREDIRDKDNPIR